MPVGDNVEVIHGGVAGGPHTTDNTREPEVTDRDRNTINSALTSGVAVIDPKNCFSDTLAGLLLLSIIDWNKSETRGDNGDGKLRQTTTAHSFRIKDLTPEKAAGLPEMINMIAPGIDCEKLMRETFTPDYEYQFSLSVNRYPVQPAGFSRKEAQTVAEAMKLLTQKGGAGLSQDAIAALSTIAGKIRR